MERQLAPAQGADSPRTRISRPSSRLTEEKMPSILQNLVGQRLAKTTLGGVCTVTYPLLGPGFIFCGAFLTGERNSLSPWFGDSQQP